MRRLRLPGRLFRALVLASAMSLPAAAQQNEIIWLRDNTSREGVVVRVTREAVTLRHQGGEATLSIDGLRPDCAYHLLRTRLSADDVRGWYELGDFAYRNGIYAEALQAYNRVVSLDPNQRAALEPRVEEVRAADAKAIFDRAAAWVAEEKYEDALRAFSLLLDKYPTSGHAAQAKEELKKLKDLILRQNEDRQKRLAAVQQQAQEQKAQADAASEAQRLTRALAGVEEGQKLFREGLDQEGQGATGRAERAWQAAASKLEEARVTLADLQATARTQNVQDAAKRELASVTRILIAAYDSLGQMAATEQSFRDAIRWFNKALALDPTDRVATDLKARMAAEQISRRVRLGY